MKDRQYLPDLVKTMRPQDRSFFTALLSRRTALKLGAAGLAGSTFLGYSSATARQSADAVMQNGELPEDAAPLEEQVLRFASDAELPGLIARVLSQELTTNTQVKQAIREWQPDLLRA